MSIEKYVVYIKYDLPCASEGFPNDVNSPGRLWLLGFLTLFIGEAPTSGLERGRHSLSITSANFLSEKY